MERMIIKKTKIQRVTGDETNCMAGRGQTLSLRELSHHQGQTGEQEKYQHRIKRSKISNKGRFSSCMLFQVQIRPWKLSDADFVLDATLPLDPRKTVFVGGVPRPLKVQKRDNYDHDDDCDDFDAPGWKTSRIG